MECAHSISRTGSIPRRISYKDVPLQELRKENGTYLKSCIFTGSI